MSYPELKQLLCDVCLCQDALFDTYSVDVALESGSILVGHFDSVDLFLSFE